MLIGHAPVRGRREEGARSSQLDVKLIEAIRVLIQGEFEVFRGRLGR